MYTVHHIDQKLCTMFKGSKQACDAFIKQHGLTELRKWTGSKHNQWEVFRIYVG